MNYDLKAPCKHCPFRYDIPGFLREERAEEIARDVLRGTGSFPCRKTLDYDSDDGEGRETDKTQMCAGALIFAEHCEQWGQMMRIVSSLQLLDLNALKMDSPVFTCEEDMISHHAEQRNPN